MPPFELGLTRYGEIDFIRWDARAGYFEISRRSGPCRSYVPTMASYVRAMLAAGRQVQQGRGRMRIDKASATVATPAPALYGWTWHK